MNKCIQRLLIDNYGDDLFRQYGRRTRRLLSGYGQLASDAEGEEEQLIDEGTAAGFVMYCVCRDRTQCGQDSDENRFHREWLARRLCRYKAVAKAAWMLSDKPSAVRKMIDELEMRLTGAAASATANDAAVIIDHQKSLFDEMKKLLGECPNPKAESIEESLKAYIRESLDDCERISRQECRRSDRIRRKLALHDRAIEICEIDLSEHFVLHEAIGDLEIMIDQRPCTNPCVSMS